MKMRITNGFVRQQNDFPTLHYGFVEVQNHFVALDYDFVVVDYEFSKVVMKDNTN